MGASAATPDETKPASILGNTSQAKAEKADSKKLSAAEVDLAVAELRYQTAFYLEACQAMMDGVTLGAEQVQDKRIEFLEAGPTTDPEAMVMMIALTLVLEGSIGPAVAALAARAVMRPIMRATAKAIYRQERKDAVKLAFASRLYRKQAPLLRERAAKETIDGAFTWNTPAPTALSKQLTTIANDLEKSAAAMKVDLRGKLGQARPVASALNDVTRFVEANLVAAAKAPLAVSTNLPGSPTPLAPGASPGVEVQAAAMASASRLRLTIKATHETLEAQLRHPDTTIDETIKLLDEYRVDDVVILSQLQESFQLATEALIWSKLLLDNSTIDIANDRAQRAAGRDLPDFLKNRSSSGIVDAPYLKFPSKLDDKMRDYLTRRFRLELIRWVGERGKRIPIREEWIFAGGLFQGQKVDGSWFKQLSKVEIEDFLVQFLTEVQSAAPTEFKVR